MHFYLIGVLIVPNIIPIIVLRPRDVRVTQYDEGTIKKSMLVKIGWKNPLYESSLPANKYHVEARAEGKEDWELCDWGNEYLKLTSIGNSAATVDGIPKYQSSSFVFSRTSKYQFRIVAIYEDDESYASDPTNYYNKDIFRKCK